MKSYTKQAKRFYKSKLWEKVRKNYLEKVHYLCERCSRPADIVHHRTYINENNLNDLTILVDEKNLEALCIECHNREHFLKPAVRTDLIFDSNGDIRKIF